MYLSPKTRVTEKVWRKQKTMVNTKRETLVILES